MIKQYTPKLAQDLNLEHQHPVNLVQQFYYEFSQTHFMLDQRFIEYCYEMYNYNISELIDYDPITEFTEHIMVQTLGTHKYNGYPHDAWEQMDEALALLLLLIDPEKMSCPGDEGIRITWMDNAEDYVSRETLERLPKRGYHPIELAEALRETPYGDFADAIAWLNSETGNIITDTGAVEDEFGEYIDTWNQETVAAIKKEWDKAQKIMDRVEKAKDWMHSVNLDTSFRQVIEFVNQLCRDSGIEG